MKLTDTLGKQQRSPRKLFVIFITNCMLYIQVGGGGSFHNFICKNCYQGNKGVEDMIHDIDRHFGKTVKVSSQIIRNIYNKLYALYSGGGRFKILFIY